MADHRGDQAAAGGRVAAPGRPACRAAAHGGGEPRPTHTNTHLPTLTFHPSLSPHLPKPPTSHTHTLPLSISPPLSHPTPPPPPPLPVPLPYFPLCPPLPVLSPLPPLPPPPRPLPPFPLSSPPPRPLPPCPPGRPRSNAWPIRSIVGGCVPSRTCCQRGGSGSPTFCSVIRRSKATIASGSSVRSSANASARRSIARESWLEIDAQRGREQGERERDGRHGRRAVALQPLGGAGDGERPERRDERQPQQAVADVAVLDVPELVRDHEPRLGGREVLQQRVVEHDALGAADARDVGVGRGRAARGVDLVDLAHLEPGLARDLEHVVAGRAGRERREPVEHRVEHDRARYVKTTAKPAMAAEPGAHQPRPKRWTPTASAAPPAADIPPPIAAPLTRSTAQPPQDCVTRPTFLARCRDAARSGSPASVLPA